MYTAVCIIIGLKKLIYETNETDLRSEFPDKKQAAVRRKITAVKLILNSLLLSSPIVSRMAIEGLPFSGIVFGFVTLILPGKRSFFYSLIG